MSKVLCAKSSSLSRGLSARRLVAFGSTALLGAVVGLVTAASAQEPATTQAAPAPSGETPRDPKGVTGISPFWEAISQGDAAFLAQDLAKATSLYQSAITNSPKDPVGHLRMAEVSLKQNEIARAEEFVQAALRFSSDMRTKVQAHFLLAEVKERQAMHDEAVAAWQNYKSLSTQLPPSKAKTARGPLPPVVYTDTADKRIVAIEAKKKLDAEYAEVRARIQKNIDAADVATGGKKAEDATSGAPQTPAK